MAFHRGRLIFPLYATIRRLDTAGTETAGGYDDIMGETALLPTSDGIGESARENLADVDVPCQVEDRDFFEQLNMMRQGNSPQTKIYLTFHLNDLKRLGLWNESADWGGRANLKIGDRVIGFKDRYGQQLFKAPENPGLFIDGVNPTGFLTTQNLVVCTLSDRSEGAV